MSPAALYHFSEDPGIERFEPRAPLERPEIEPLVWAIDEWHAPMYFLPRDCPRACFWPIESTTAADRERWFRTVAARMVITVESAWLQRIRDTTLFRYTMPGEAFVLNDTTAGHYVAPSAVTPAAIEPVGDLLEALMEANVELRVTPRLGPLWCAVVSSTMAFSGTRLRNAVGYPEDFPPTTA